MCDYIGLIPAEVMVRGDKSVHLGQSRRLNPFFAFETAQNRV